MTEGEGKSAVGYGMMVGRAIASLIFLFCSLSTAAEKPEPIQTLGTVHAEVVRLSPHEDMLGYFYVSTRLDVQASDRSLVIPYCDRSKSGDYVPCYAQLERMHGKKWAIAKTVCCAVMGVEGVDTWKALVLAPGESAHFDFGIDQWLFGIREGEGLRVRMGAWESSDSWNNGKPDHFIWSTVFHFSSKPLKPQD